MSSTREQISPCRQRQYADDLQLSKRLKPNIKLHSAEFYDSLSKVWLTRRALKEFDRRTTSQINDSRHSASTSRHSASTPRRLTRNTSNKIRALAKDGGPDLCDIRGYPAPTNIDLAHTMGSNYYLRSSDSRKSKSTAPTSNKRSSAYDKDFEQHLIDHKIYPKGYDYLDNRKAPEPGNLEEFYQRLAQPRASLSLSRFTTSDFRAFDQKNDRVIKENDVMRDVVPIITGNSDIPNRQNLLFSRLDPIANNTTVNAKPDFYDGARLTNVDNKVREDLGSYIIPTEHMIAPVAPNFFLEVKGPNGSPAVVQRQACYNGALGARGMHQLQSYGQDEPVYDGNAYTITTTYQAGNLRMYTTHPTQAEDGTTEYHMSTVGGWDTLGDPDTCRRGVTALRNARDYAQEQRDVFISAANERATSTNAAELPSEYDVSNLTDVQSTLYAQDTTYTPMEDLADNSQYYTSQQEFQ